MWRMDCSVTLIQQYLREVNSDLYKEAGRVDFRSLCRSMNLDSELPDRIEIISHPGADRSISMEGLKNYRTASRRYRNRRIGEFLKELRLTEGRNTGFQKIRRALQSNGSPEPLFETDEERTYFMATIYAHPDFIRQGDGLGEGLNDVLTDEEQTVETLILQLATQNPMITVADMAVAIGKSKTTIERAMRHLKEEGRIERVGGKKNGQWIVS